MTSHTVPSRARARRAILVLSTLAIGLALTACGAARPRPATPATSAPPDSTTLGTGRAPDQPTVVGKLSVLLALTTGDSVLPRQPVSYALFVTAPGTTVGTQHPVGADGAFALALPAGAYELTYLEVRAADLGPDPVTLPLTTNERLVLRAPATGCVYGGEVEVVYGRLPAGSEQEQAALVARASENNKEAYSFVYRPDGGFVMAGASVSMPARSQRPATALGCVAEEFGWTSG